MKEKNLGHTIKSWPNYESTNWSRPGQMINYFLEYTSILPNIYQKHSRFPIRNKEKPLQHQIGHRGAQRKRKFTLRYHPALMWCFSIQSISRFHSSLNYQFQGIYESSRLCCRVSSNSFSQKHVQKYESKQTVVTW